MGSDSSVFPLNQTVYYTITGTSTNVPVNSLTGTTTSWMDSQVYATFYGTEHVPGYDGDVFSTQVLVETGGCSQTLDWNSDAPNIWGGDYDNN
jgi:hypothetical protein